MSKKKNSNPKQQHLQLIYINLEYVAYNLQLSLLAIVYQYIWHCILMSNILTRMKTVLNAYTSTNTLKF